MISASAHPFHRFRAPSSGSESSLDDSNQALLDFPLSNSSCDETETETETEAETKAEADYFRWCSFNPNRRHEFQHEFENDQQNRATHAVKTSPLYGRVQSELSSSRARASASLESHARQDSNDYMSTLTDKEQLLIQETAEVLRALHLEGEGQLSQAETWLEQYTQARQVEAARVAKEQEKIEAEKFEKQRKQEQLESLEREKVKQAQDERERRERTRQDKQREEEKQKLVKEKHDEMEKEKLKKSKQHIIAYTKRLALLKSIEKTVGHVTDSKDPEVKKIRLQVKKNLGEAINQISSQPASIRRVVEKLCQLLDDARHFGGPYHAYAMDQMASRLVTRAKLVTNFRECFPIAHVVMMTCVHTSEMVDLFLAHLNQECVHTIPDYPKQRADQTIDEYRLMMGWRKEGDKWEDFSAYSFRMSIFVALYAAVGQTAPWQGQSQPETLSLGALWSWIARVVNAPPHLLTATILLAMVEVAGFELSKKYRIQFHKLLVLIASEVCPKLSNDSKTGAAAAAGRLREFLSDYEQAECVLKEPEGRQMKESEVTEKDEEREDGGGGESGRGRNLGRGRGRARARGRGRGKY